MNDKDTNDTKLRNRYWEEKHRHQIYDLGGDGYYIEADRIDRPDIQDLRVRVFAKGKIIEEKRTIYNIKYDYHRSIWTQRGKIFFDYLFNNETYGHLREEDNIPPEEGSIYPFSYEPVTEAGTEMFRKEGFHLRIKIPELHLVFRAHMFIEETYEQGKYWSSKPDDLISRVEECWDMYVFPHKHKFDPVEARKERLEFFKEQAEYLLIPEVPIDYRFVD